MPLFNALTQKCDIVLELTLLLLAIAFLRVFTLLLCYVLKSALSYLFILRVISVFVGIPT